MLIIGDPLASTERKNKCTAVKKVAVFVFVDYRKKPYQKLIKKMFETSLKEGYEFNWVGYFEDSERYDFTACGKGIRFDDAEYDHYKSECDFPSNQFSFLFVGYPVDDNEAPYMISSCSHSNESVVMNVFRIADTLIKSDEMDVNKRFAEVKKMCRKDKIFDTLTDPGTDLINVLGLLIPFW